LASYPSSLPILPNQPPEKNKLAGVSFVLNGIFFSDNDGYALINNQIVRENGYISGTKAGFLTIDAVELNKAGQIIILPNTSNAKLPHR